MPRKKKPDPPTQKLILENVSSEAIHLLQKLAFDEFKDSQILKGEGEHKTDFQLKQDFNNLSRVDQRKEFGALIEQLIREEFIRQYTQRGHDVVLNHYNIDQSWLIRKAQPPVIE